MGIIKLAINDDNDENLKTRYIKNHVTTNIIPSIKFKQNKIPTQVATPFPPLNLSQTGKIWPKKTERLETNIYSGK